MNEHQIRVECLTLAIQHCTTGAPRDEVVQLAKQLYKFITKKTPALPVIV